MPLISPGLRAVARCGDRVGRRFPTATIDVKKKDKKQLGPLVRPLWLWQRAIGCGRREMCGHPQGPLHNQPEQRLAGFPRDSGVRNGRVDHVN